MKWCDYCGRENAEDAIRCHECGCVEWKRAASPAGSKAMLSSSASADEPEPALISTQGTATIIRCRTPVEAALVMKKFEAAGIITLVPVEDAVRRTTGALPIQVSTRALAAHKDLHDCVTFAYDTKIRARQPLPLVMKIIAFLLPLLFPIGMIFFIVDARAFKVQGFQKMARDWACWFGFGTAAWVTILTLVIICSVRAGWRPV